MPPHVAIIVPVFNGSRFILNLIDTVRAQTLTDWELIIVDDGSTDDLVAQLAQAPTDNRRRLVRQLNAGRSNARNRGLAQTRAGLVVFLDVDDGWQPTFLASLCAALNQAPQAVAAFCGWQYMDAAGQPLPQTVLISAPEARRLAADLEWRNSLLPSGLVTRRPAVLAAGGFDETLHGTEDWDLWLRLRAYGAFLAVPAVLTWYRTHTDSTSENVLGMERERLKLHAKHLGSLDEPLAHWPLARRRAVGYTYFNTALGCLWQNDMANALEKIRWAVDCWPALLDLDEFYYELGCARQPRGQRGSPVGLNLKEGEALIHTVLFDPATLRASPAAARHWGQACLVLARLARNTHQQPAGRRYALRALLQTSAGRNRLEAARLLARSLVPAALLAGRRRGSRPIAPQPQSRP